MSIRVVLALDSPALCQAVKTILRERAPEVQILAETADPLDLLVAIAATGANTVIQSWPESGRMPGICTHLFCEYPDLRIIGIPSDADRMYVCQQQVTIHASAVSGLEDLITEIQRVLPPEIAVGAT